MIWLCALLALQLGAALPGQDAHIDGQHIWHEARRCAQPAFSLGPGTT